MSGPTMRDVAASMVKRLWMSSTGSSPGPVTAGLATLLGLGGVGHSYEESPRWLAQYLLFGVAQKTVRSETE